MIQPQPSARSTSKFQSNLVSVPRNYVPVNSSNALLSKNRMKLLNSNKQDKVTTTMSSLAEQTSSKNTVKESTSVQNATNKLNKKINANTNELNKSSFMEDVRTIVKKIYYMFV